MSCAKDSIKKKYLESVYMNNLDIINPSLSRTFFHQVEILKVQSVGNLVQINKDLHRDKKREGGGGGGGRGGGRGLQTMINAIPWPMKCWINMI